MPMINFQKIFDFSPLPIYVLQDGFFRLANSKMAQLTGYTLEELLRLPFAELIHPEDRPRVVNNALHRLAGKEVPEDYEFRAISRRGELFYIRGFFSQIEFNERPAILGQIMDITDHKRADEKLQASEKRLKKQVNYLNTLIDNMNEVFFTYDMHAKITFANKKAWDAFGYSQEEIIGRNVLEFVPEAYKTIVQKGIQARLEKGEPGSYETLALHKDGSNRILKINVSPIIEDGEITGGMILAEDITERKQAEEQLKYLSLHDPLTGLYNRTFFEQEMRRLGEKRRAPVGIILCDIDGLKLVNDTLGHDTGDDLLVIAARIIRDSFRRSDMVARIGGDEFAVLLPNSPRSVVENACRRIHGAVSRYNAVNPELPLSISVGFAVGSEASANMGDLFKEADNNMYREKLHRSQSARSAIVQTLMKALEARDFITEGHADRLQDMLAGVSVAIGLSGRRVTDLRLLAQFHDIGKVGIPDRILNKPGPLTPEEAVEMRRHCEIGYRIAQSAPDLAPIAEWILKHHEWWNGKGYPLELQGEEIPLECRLLAIADAYDAMTSDRPYRKAMPHKEALAEIRKCSGTQFDPQLVLKFVHVLENQNRRAASK